MEVIYDLTEDIREVGEKLLDHDKSYSTNIKTYLSKINDSDKRTMLAIILASKEFLLSEEKAPMSKLLAARLIKESMDLNVYDFCMLVKEHILDIFQNYALHEKGNPDEKKGRTLLGVNATKEVQTIANSLFRLVLECLDFWAHWYPDDNKFPIVYNELLLEEVSFPSAINYFKKATKEPRQMKGQPLVHHEEETLRIPENPDQILKEKNEAEALLPKQYEIRINWDELKVEFLNNLKEFNEDLESWRKLIQLIEMFQAKSKGEIEDALKRDDETEINELIRKNEEATEYLENCNKWIGNIENFKTFREKYFKEEVKLIEKLPPEIEDEKEEIPEHSVNPSNYKNLVMDRYVEEDDDQPKQEHNIFLKEEPREELKEETGEEPKDEENYIRQKQEKIEAIKEEIFSDLKNFKSNIQKYIKSVAIPEDVLTIDAIIEAVERVIDAKDSNNVMESVLAIKMIKDVMDTKPEAFAGRLAASNLISKMKAIAFFRPESVDINKGKYYFGQSLPQETLKQSLTFFIINLECLLVWHNWFPQEIYLKIIKDILKENIYLPIKFNYFKKEDLHAVLLKPLEMVYSDYENALNELLCRFDKKFQETDDWNSQVFYTYSAESEIEIRGIIPDLASVFSGDESEREPFRKKLKELKSKLVYLPRLQSEPIENEKELAEEISKRFEIAYRKPNYSISPEDDIFERWKEAKGRAVRAFEEFRNEIAMMEPVVREFDDVVVRIRSLFNTNLDSQRISELKGIESTASEFSNDFLKVERETLSYNTFYQRHYKRFKNNDFTVESSYIDEEVDIDEDKSVNHSFFMRHDLSNLRNNAFLRSPKPINQADSLMKLDETGRPSARSEQEEEKKLETIDETSSQNRYKQAPLKRSIVLKHGAEVVSTGLKKRELNNSLISEKNTINTSSQVRVSQNQRKPIKLKESGNVKSFKDMFDDDENDVKIPLKASTSMRIDHSAISDSQRDISMELKASFNKNNEFGKKKNLETSLLKENVDLKQENSSLKAKNSHLHDENQRLRDRLLELESLVSSNHSQALESSIKRDRFNEILADPGENNHVPVNAFEVEKENKINNLKPVSKTNNKNGEDFDDLMD